MDEIDLEPVARMQKGIAGVQVLLYVPGQKNPVQSRPDRRSPITPGDIQRPVALEGTGVRVHLFMVGFFYQGCRRMAPRCLGYNTPHAAPHLSNIDETPGTNQTMFAAGLGRRLAKRMDWGVGRKSKNVQPPGSDIGRHPGDRPFFIRRTVDRPDRHDAVTRFFPAL